LLLISPGSQRRTRQVTRPAWTAVRRSRVTRATTTAPASTSHSRPRTGRPVATGPGWTRPTASTSSSPHSTPNQIAFHFGHFHTSQYPKFSLAPGIRVQVGINGATSATTVSYRW